MLASRPTTVRWLGYGLLALAATGVAIELARPLRTASIAFDSQVAVLHFQRLIEGRQLEAFLTTTPKPLLTVLFGPLYGLTGDWRPIAWATIAAYVLAVVLAAVLARRVAGPIAAAFSGVAVMLAPALLFDVGFALATPWAMLLWLLAGLAATETRPRWALVGLALGLASLARLETLVVVGVALIAVAWASFAPIRYVPGGRPVRAAWLVPAIGLLAIPVMMVHDTLLTGDPLLWTTVAARYSASTRLHVMTPVEVVGFLVDRYWSIGALTILAVIGLLRLWRPGGRALVVGLVGLGPGVAAFLALLAVRGIFVSDRYAAPIDLAVAFAAGIGFAGLSAEVGRAVPALVARFGPGLRAVLPIGIAAVAAVVLAGPYWSVDPDVRPAVRRSLRLAADADRSVPVLATALAGGSGSAGASPEPLLFVPVPVRPRLVVDLDLLLGQVAGTDPTRVDLAAGYPGPGQYVIHSLAGDPDLPGFADLQTDEPTVVAGVTVEPLVADAERGLWVVRLR